jgi:hypothetical protein
MAVTTVEDTFCPGQKPPFWEVKRPVQAYKSGIQQRFTAGHAKNA